MHLVIRLWRVFRSSLKMMPSHMFRAPRKYLSPFFACTADGGYWPFMSSIVGRWKIFRECQGGDKFRVRLEEQRRR
jgi:hypothetical protein